MNNAQLDTLLKWHNVQKGKNDNKEAKIIKWQQIWENGVQPPSFERWTLDDKAKLNALQKMEIDLSETAIGQLEQRKKREVTIAIRKMTREERERLKTMMMEMDEGDKE